MNVCFIPTYVSGVIFYRVWQPYLSLKRLSGKDKFSVIWYEPDVFELYKWEWEIYERDKRAVFYNQFDAACRWADVIVWMGLHTPKSLDLFYHFRAKYGKPFMTEVDDYIFSIPRYNVAAQSYRPGHIVTTISLSQIKGSDGLIVSTPYLKELYSPYNKNIHVIENAVDLRLWRDSSSACRRLTIGWMGGGSHNEDHELVKDAVFEILKKYPNVVFRYICGGKCPEFFEGVDRIKWEHDFRAIDKYPKWMCSKKFDIGIAPLVDNNFNRSKSNLRWLEYSAMGIPTVASNVQHFRESIIDEQTGFLADTPGEWVDCLSSLIESEELRKTIGGNAKNAVKRDWNPKIMAKKYLRVLKETANAITYAGKPCIAYSNADKRHEYTAIHDITDSRRNTESAGMVCT